MFKNANWQTDRASKDRQIQDLADSIYAARSHEISHTQAGAIAAKQWHHLSPGDRVEYRQRPGDMPDYGPGTVTGWTASETGKPMVLVRWDAMVQTVGPQVEAKPEQRDRLHKLA